MSAIAPARRRGRRHSIRRPRTGFLLVLPALLVAVGLFVVPLLLAARMSVSDWPLLGEPSFTGLENYRAIADNDLVGQALGFTAKYAAVILVVLLAVGLGLAMLVRRPRRGVGLLRTAFFLPAAVGLTSAALLFYELYFAGLSPVDDALTGLGLIDKPIDWLGQPGTAFLSVVIMMTWRFAGFYMLILLAGLQSIPDDVYEAARLDGASRWQTLRHVTLPLLRPSLALCTILIITGALLAFEQFYVLTNGGPDNSTVTLVIVIVREAFSFLDLGSAAAISMVVLGGLIVLNVVQLVALRRER
ncbi:carbohydrate ABC transporter permease [Jiangella alba]|uniref:Multiple sugar transport system permease protein n=1 Tax=Jiangella alba TaxID=561176 RepID=A0A1H5PND7_9ACTN|nr:sugar ABC transporter permease [Jiangella alba]SEF15275.1 multiple sugar transport system permease protein [Jiangella alba]